MSQVDWTALTIFILLFAFITWLGFAAANWRKGDLDQGSGLRRALDPKLRMIGFGERFGQRQPELGLARTRIRPSIKVRRRFKRGRNLFLVHADSGVANA